MSTGSRLESWIEHNNHRIKLLKEAEAAPLTRNEMVEKLQLPRDVVLNLLRQLHGLGCLKKVNGDICSVTGRAIHRYTTTDVKYVPKDFTARRARYEANKALRERRKINKPPVAKKVQEPVIKVNEYTTIYLNSLRPTSDFTLKKERKSRRNSAVAMGSGMTLFGTW